jgi:hypothetical protein
MECWRAACITIGVRIPPSATTATLAAQTSAQTVLAGDSFAVILSAASEKPVSAQPVAGCAAKEQSLQGSAGRGAGKQVEAQTPSAQGNRGARTSTVSLSNDRIEADIDEAPAGRQNINQPDDRIASVVTVRNWSPTLNVSTIQSPAASTIASGTTSASPIAARTTWSAGTFSAPIAGSSQQPTSSEGLTSWAAQTQTDGRVVNRKASVQAVPQVPALRGNGNTIGATAIPQPIQVSTFDTVKLPEQQIGRSSKDGSSAAPAGTADNENSMGATAIPQPIQASASDVENLPGRENGESRNGESSAVSARSASVAVATAWHDVAQSPASQSTSNAATPVHAQPSQDARTPTAQSTSIAAVQERGQSSRNPQTSATPMDSTIEGVSDASAEPNGLPGPVEAPVEFAAAQAIQQSMALPIRATSLPSLAVVSSKETGIEAVSDTTQKADSSAAKPTNSDLASAANSGTSKSKDDASGSGDAPVRNTQNAQADPSQGASSTSRVQDIAASHPQVQTVVSPAVTHEPTIAPRGSDAPANASHPGTAREAGAAVDLDGVEATPTSSGVSAAKLMQAMSESEMHIGLSSSGFGDISIRTSVSNHQMLAQISLDHSELSQAISAHVSSVQAKLSDDYGLRASIEINNLPSSHSGEPGGSSQREKGAAAASLPGESTAAQGEERSGVGQEVFASAGNGSRLDIRA